MADGIPDEQRLRGIVTDVINEHVAPRLDQINGRVGKTEARVSELETRVESLENGSDRRTTLLESIDKKIDKLTDDLAPWVRREQWWQRGKQYTVKGYSFSRRAVISLGMLAGGVAGILALLGQVPWI